jgi:hypothetical protein
VPIAEKLSADRRCVEVDALANDPVAAVVEQGVSWTTRYDDSGIESRQ